jgi:2-C-methyl-D-erythritol 4-phosphate cytidylyltransferase
MGFDKLAAPLNGTPVLQRTLDAFLAARSIAEIVIVCSQERWDQVIGEGGFSKPVRRIDGGMTRQDSVVAGLDAISNGVEMVAVHDGARPLVSPLDIDHCVNAAQTHRAAALARRVAETLKRSDSDDFSSAAISRDRLWFMETPQVFEVPLLRQAYEFVSQHDLVVTDEVSAMEALGIRVKFVESRHPNPKITTPADLALAEALLR